MRSFDGQNPIKDVREPDIRTCRRQLLRPQCGQWRQPKRNVGTFRWEQRGPLEEVPQDTCPYVHGDPWALYVTINIEDR